MTMAAETKSALQWADTAMHEATAGQAPHIQAAVWVYRAWPLARQEEAVQAVASMHKGLAMLRLHVLSEERPVLLTSIGLTYRALGLPVQALVPLRQAHAHFCDGPLLERRLRSRENLIDTVHDAFDQLVTLQPAEPPPEASVEELLERALTAQALGHGDRAAALARQVAPLLPADAQLRLAREPLWASQLADSTGDAVLALAWYRRFHARVIGNEHAAFEARLDELAATVEDQSLQLAVSNLQRRNAGLVSTFQQLSEQALTDTLTGVANRRGLQDAFDAVQVAVGPLVLAMIDLDHFKSVNDQHSHVVGDKVLEQIALLMRQALREADLLARFGGEEFTALLVNTQLPEARAVAERLRVVVQTHDWQAIAAGLQVTVSVGLSEVASGQAMQDAVGDADRHLYRAKQGGRNRTECSGSESARAKDSP